MIVAICKEIVRASGSTHQCATLSGLMRRSKHRNVPRGSSMGPRLHWTSIAHLKPA